MRSFLIFLCLLAGVAASAQLKCPELKLDTAFYSGRGGAIASITQTCSDNVWVYQFSNEGDLTAESRFLLVKQPYSDAKKKVLHGLQRTYQHGRLINEQNYNTGVLCGRERQYSNSGMLIREANYICIDSNGALYPVLHGKYIERDRYSLIKKSEGYYRRGQKHGKWKTYYSNGNLQAVQNFWCGFMSGREIQYHNNGRLIKRSYYTLKLDNGVIRSVLDGKYMERNTSSTVLIKKGRYKDGKLHGLFREYYQNGNKKTIIRYRKGKVAGKYNHYYESGKRMIKARAKADTSRYRNELYFDGRFRRYAENGFLVMDYHYKNGQLNGKIQEFYSNGKLKSVAHYKNNLKDGPEYKYFNDELTEMYTWKIIDTGVKHYTVLHGPFEIRNAQGVTRGTYLFNHYHNEYLQYYPGGKLKSVVNYDTGVQTKQSFVLTEKGDTIDYSEFITLGRGNQKRSYLHGRRFTLGQGLKPIRNEWIYHRGGIKEYASYYDNKLYIHHIGLVSHESFNYILQGTYYENGELETLSSEGPNGRIFAISWYPQGQLKSYEYKLHDSLYESAKIIFASNAKLISARYLGNLSYVLSESEAIAQAALLPSRTEFKRLIESRNPETVSFTNAKTFIKIERLNGLMHGTQTLFDINGDTIISVSHRNGAVTGYFYSKTAWNTYSRGEFHNDKFYRRWLHFQGKYPVNEYEYDSNGIMLNHLYSSSATGKKLRYNDYVSGEEFHWNGNDVLIQDKVLLDKEKRTYTVSSYYDSGKLRNRGTSNQSGLFGVYEFFYENGKVQIRDNYVNGYRYGLSETYYEDGRLMLKGMNNYTQVGWWEKYDTKGNKSFIVYSVNGTFETIEHLPCDCGDSSVKFSFGTELSSAIRFQEWPSISGPLSTLFEARNYHQVSYKDLKERKDGQTRSLDMKLAVFEKYSLKTGHNRYNYLVLNPCVVNGFESLIPLKFTYDTKLRTTSGNIAVKRVAMEFDGNWIGFYDTLRNRSIIDHRGHLMPFRQLFRVDGIDFTQSFIKINNPVNENLCPGSWANVAGTDVLFNISNAELFWEASAADAAEEFNKVLLERQMFPYNSPVKGTEKFTGIVSNGGKMLINLNGKVEFNIEHLMLSNSRMDGIISMPAVIGADNMIRFIKDGVESKISIHELKSHLMNRFNAEVLITFHQGRAIIYFNKFRQVY